MARPEDPLADDFAARPGAPRARWLMAWGEIPVTVSLLAIIAAVFLLTQALGGPELGNLIRLGGDSPALVREGQWFRLFTANFIHIGWLHVYLNGMALVGLGGLLERLVGRSRYLAIWLLSALGGAGASAWAARAPVSAGASTALFGLLGAWLFLTLRFRERLPWQFRRGVGWWTFQLGINAALVLVVPQIDWVAHVGGFTAGALSAAVLCPSPRAREAATESQVWPLTAVLVAAFVAAFALDARYALSGADFEADVFRSLAGARGGNANALNAAAWTVAVDPKSSDRLLDLARGAAEKAVAMDASAENVDTLATVRYRQWDLSTAVDLECRAIALDPKNDDFKTQLRRFLAREVRSDAVKGPVAVDLCPDGLRIDPPPSGGVRLFALFVGGGKADGVLSLEAGGKAAAGPLPLPEELDGVTPRFTAKPEQAARCAEGLALPAACVQPAPELEDDAVAEHLYPFNAGMKVP